MELFIVVVLADIISISLRRVIAIILFSANAAQTYVCSHPLREAAYKPDVIV